MQGGVDRCDGHDFQGGSLIWLADCKTNRHVGATLEPVMDEETYSFRGWGGGFHDCRIKHLCSIKPQVFPGTEENTLTSAQFSVLISVS